MPNAPDVTLYAVLTFICATALVAGLAPGRWAPALALGLGALAGVALLEKLNTGITVVALGRGRHRRRALAATAAGGPLRGRASSSRPRSGGG